MIPAQLFTPNDPFLVVNAPVRARPVSILPRGTHQRRRARTGTGFRGKKWCGKVELRGDELKDSHVNRDGPLRSQTVYVDINRALNNANAGVPTLIAKDSLQSYQARLERTVAERSTLGGVVLLNSQGEAIVESGAVFDISGGSGPSPRPPPTTLVMSRGY
jgi:hypothetical protein